MSSDTGESGMSPTESNTTRMVENFSHGSRATPATSASRMEADRSEKTRCHTPDMRVAGESMVPAAPAAVDPDPSQANSADIGETSTKPESPAEPPPDPAATFFPYV